MKNIPKIESNIIIGYSNFANLLSKIKFFDELSTNKLEISIKILKKLERLYNVTIIDNRQELSNEFFNAAIDVENEDIEKVLNYFNKIYKIEYQIFDNKIIIKKNKIATKK